MINVQPYMDKLNCLQEWVNNGVDDRYADVLNVSLTMEMFYNYGVLFYKPLVIHETIRHSTFEEYYKQQIAKS